MLAHVERELHVMVGAIAGASQNMIGSLNNTSYALTAQRLLKLNQLRQQNSFERLSTGRRINRGADDPAGLIASESLSATLAALEAETKVSERQQSIASTADAALGEVSSLLTEAKRLTVANADSTLSDAERQANQAQIDSIVASVDRVANTTQFNGKKLLDGSLTLSVTGASQAVTAVSATTIGKQTISSVNYTLNDVRTGGSLATTKNQPESTAAVVDQAIKDVATLRAKVGSFQTNVLDSHVNALSVATENLSAARSAIQDTDYAAESAQRIRASLLTAAGTSTFKSVLKSQRQVFSLLA